MSKPGFANDHLKSFIDRIERMNEEVAAMQADIKEIYSEAKGTGFDTKIMRQVIRIRKMDKADRQEQEAILDLYLHALGMLADTPLGQAAVETKKSVASSPEYKAAQKTKNAEMRQMINAAAVETPVAKVTVAAPPPPKPTMDVTNEIPSFLLRTKPPPQPVT